MSAQHCDYLVIGGGSAGCIVASRIAEQNMGQVILLEAGKSDQAEPSVTDLKRLDEQPKSFDWGFKASPLAGGSPELNYARAKILGGCANHNDCAFLRPPDSDFDEWERQGAVGWNSQAMAPFYQMVRQRTHVEDSKLHPLSQAFIAAGVEKGLEVRDFGEAILPGVGAFPLNAVGKLRQSSSITYIHNNNKLGNNLQILTEALATRILFQGTKAIGAETTIGNILASKAVILCAGAIQTPQLLMLSGLGDEKHLAEFGINPVIDNPNIGQNLQDHVAAPVVWQTKSSIGEWEVCPFEATMLLQIEEHAPAPDVLFHFGLRVREKYGDHPRLATAGPAVKASPNVARARSRGSVRLNGPYITDMPNIDLNFLSDPYDVAILRKALNFTRELFATKSFQSVLSHEIHPGPTVQTDEQWLAYMRHVCETVYHPCGTAAIGKVVTPDLQVIGCENLFVADASVFPTIPTVNINCAVMMTAEMATIRILKATHQS